MPERVSVASRLPFPGSGTSWPDLKTRMIQAKRDDIDWRAGKLALYNYYRDEDLLRVATDAYNLHFAENAMGSRIFPALAKMEREIVEMALSLFSAPPEAGGSFTGGGTESIFLAVCAARNAKPVSGRPNIVACETLHPAFDKAAMYLGLDVVRTPMLDDFRADPVAIEAAIDANTVMIAASAPGFSHGVFDPIAEIGLISQRRGIWYHVDACYGGFLAPFLSELGQAIPAFDFHIPGVTSLSADLHKYGFAARGASLLLLREETLKRFHRFEFAWPPVGIYSTEGFPGSRPGGSVAAAWAIMNHLGREGYLENARLILDAKTRLMAGIDKIPGLEILGPSEFAILLYGSIEPALDLDALAEALARKGWYCTRIYKPKAIHLSLNPVHTLSANAYLVDLRTAADEVRSKGLRGEADLRTY
jgi:sphinganine-1-phosphate aldolase